MRANRRNQLLACLAAVSLAMLGCGSEDDSGDAAAGPGSRSIDYERALADAPPPLASLYDQANELLGGGTEAFDRRLAELRGHPVVVNKWASWCGPCRAEFPYFQSLAAKHGEKVAFIGVDADDSDEAAQTFLEEFPVPYPSYSDPDSEIATSLDAAIEFPATIFIDSEGDNAYVQRGGYASEEDLAADIERYAR